MRIPLVDLRAQYESIKDEIDDAMRRVIETSSFILGDEVEAFENAFATYCGAKHCVGVASGTAALSLALLANDIGDGDEVITSPFTFIATAEAISHCGARPVFVDIEPKTMNIDASRIERSISEKTRAILPVHLYGQPCDMSAINAIASKHDLLVIEDAAQAHGAEYRGIRTGSLADAACFSFYPGKNLGAYGDGGAVVSNSDRMVERIRMLRNHGRCPGEKYQHSLVGFGERIDGLHSAILNVKLRYLEEWTNRRIELASRYSQLLNDLELATPKPSEESRHAYHLYVLKVSGRDDVWQSMRSAGIGVGIHYPVPIHLQPAYAELGHCRGDFPEAEEAAMHVISLPLFPEIRIADQNRVVSALKGAVRRL